MWCLMLVCYQVEVQLRWSRIKEEARVRGGIEALPFSAVGEALEVIPRTLCQNCGTDTIRVITKLRVRIE